GGAHAADRSAGPLDGLLPRRRVRTLGAHGRGLGRPVRVVARRAAPEGRSWPDGPLERAPGGRGAPRGAEARCRDGARVHRERPLHADRTLARFGAWYELFPRSWGGFKGVERVLPDLAELGFDVVYFPPIHPIGETNRKGRNNSLTAAKNDPGSPW